MLPWAEWLVKHNMRFVLLILCAIAFPAYFMRPILKSLQSGYLDWKYDFLAIKNEKVE